MLNFSGFITAALSFISIGLGFIWVIKLEYHAGAKVWILVLPLGIALIAASLFTQSFWLSAILGLSGGTVVWGAAELPEQQKRAAAGQFKSNPGKKWL